MTPLRRKQLKDNIFLKFKTRQALTVFVLRCIFCFGHELGRAFLLQHSPPSSSSSWSVFWWPEWNCKFYLCTHRFPPSWICDRARLLVENGCGVPWWHNWVCGRPQCPDLCFQQTPNKIKKKRRRNCWKTLLMNMTLINKNYWIQKECGDVVLDD